MASRVTRLARNAKPVKKDEVGKGIAKKRKAESRQETASPQRNGVCEKKKKKKKEEEEVNKEKPEGLNGGTALPVRNKKGELVFEEEKYNGVWKELPADWLEGLDIPQQVASAVYREAVNTYKVKCGGSLEMWESSGWIVPQDTYGWFQWYCRFYQGRRTADDSRQVGRWERCAGVKGRWRNNLITKVVRSGCEFDNHTVSPVVRQTLQHWGYRLTQEDYQQGAKRLKPK